MKTKASNGVQLTQALFYEFNNPDAPFTLRIEDYTSRKGKKYTSMYQIYMDSVDEYDAIQRLGLTKLHWDKLCKLSWFMEGVELTPDNRLPGLIKWREDMRERDSSRAKKILLAAIEQGDTNAAKFLYTEMGKDIKSAGRPEKKIPAKSTSSAVALLRKIEGGKK